MNTERIDVLAVIDRHIRDLEFDLRNHLTEEQDATLRAAQQRMLDAARAARAVVAELIEADREFDDSHAAYAVAKTGNPRNAAWDRVLVAKGRRQVALARIGGSP